MRRPSCACRPSSPSPALRPSPILRHRPPPDARVFAFRRTAACSCAPRSGDVGSVTHSIKTVLTSQILHKNQTLIALNEISTLRNINTKCDQNIEMLQAKLIAQCLSEENPTTELVRSLQNEIDTLNGQLSAIQAVPSGSKRFQAVPSGSKRFKRFKLFALRVRVWVTAQ